MLQHKVAFDSSVVFTCEVNTIDSLDCHLNVMRLLIVAVDEFVCTGLLKSENLGFFHCFIKCRFIGTVKYDFHFTRRFMGYNALLVASSTLCRC